MGVTSDGRMLYLIQVMKVVVTKKLALNLKFQCTVRKGHIFTHFWLQVQRRKGERKG